MERTAVIKAEIGAPGAPATGESWFVLLYDQPVVCRVKVGPALKYVAQLHMIDEDKTGYFLKSQIKFVEKIPA